MSFQAVFELIPVLVGAIFAAIGFFSLKHFLSMRAHGERVEGEVKAIEKYVSTMRTGGRTTSGLMYRPIVTYTFEGQEREIKGVSVNQLRHRLGQHLEVLVQKNRDTGEIVAVLNESANMILGLVLLGAGLLSLGLGATRETSTALGTGFTVAVIFVIAAVIEQLTRRSSSLPEVKQADSPEKDSTLITNAEELEKEVVLHQKIGYVIAFVALAIGVWVMYLGISQLSAREYALLFSHPFELLGKASDRKPLQITGIGAFFALAGLYSFLYQIRHYRFLLKR